MKRASEVERRHEATVHSAQGHHTQDWGKRSAFWGSFSGLLFGEMLIT
ncbi:MAG: hypothetical protein JJE39_15630 [Vicinamibacteria bacterium]|nr:hypothetical protein [Vicinamibacteria bacterium]